MGRVECRGASWRKGFRDDAVIDLVSDRLKTVRKALADFTGWRLRIRAVGTTWEKPSSAGGSKPFKSEELAELVRKSVQQAKMDVAVEAAPEAKPEIYGDDSPRLLRGKVSNTGEHFVIVVEGIE